MQHRVSDIKRDSKSMRERDLDMVRVRDRDRVKVTVTASERNSERQGID